MPFLSLYLNPANRLGYKRILVKADDRQTGSLRDFYKYRNAHSLRIDVSCWYHTQVCFLKQREVS